MSVLSQENIMHEVNQHLENMASQLCALLESHSLDSAALFGLGSSVLEACRKHRRTITSAKSRSLTTDAAAAIERSLEDTPSADGFVALARAYKSLGGVKETVRCLERSLEINPEHLEAVEEYGSCMLDIGDLDKAVQKFSLALQIDPLAPRANYRLAQLGSHPSPAEACKRLSSIAEFTQGKSKTLTHLAIATICESNGEFDSAFRSFSKASQSKRPKDGRGQEAIEKLIQSSVSIYTREWFLRRAESGSPSRRPILIIGIPRSGTTLVEQIITSHSDVSSAGEPLDLGCIARQIPSDPNCEYPLSLHKADSHAIEVAADSYEESLISLAGDYPRITDKNPLNFMHLAAAVAMFPNATVLHCRRDKMDVAVSCFRNDLKWPFCDLEAFDRLWHQYERLMQHWRDVLPVKILEVVYEKLVVDHKRVIPELLDACSLPLQSECVRFYDNKRQVRTPSRTQVRRPIYSSSIGAWKKYERQLRDRGMTFA